MAQTLTNFDAMLKTFYGVDTVTELVKQKAPFLEKFKKSKLVSADGRNVVVPLHYARNQGVGARGETGLLPTAGNQGYVNLTIPYKYNHARIQLTGPAIKQSMTSEGAFEHVVDAEIKGAVKDMARDISRQLFGDGYGTLCRDAAAASAGATTARTLIDGQGVADNDDAPGRYLKAGMFITYMNATAFDVVTTIVSVAADFKSMVTASINPAAATARIVKSSTAADTVVADTGYDNELMGLLGMIDDGTYRATYFGATRSSYAKLYSYVLDLGGGALTLDGMQKCFDGVDQATDGYPQVLVCHHLVRREYLALLQVMKRYVNERALSPDGGFKGAALKSNIEFNEVPIIADRDCPYGLLFGVDFEDMWRFDLTDGEWAEEDGTIMLRVAGVDAYEGRYRKFGNVACLAPCKNFVIRGIKIGTPEAIGIAD